MIKCKNCDIQCRPFMAPCMGCEHKHFPTIQEHVDNAKSQPQPKFKQTVQPIYTDSLSDIMHLQEKLQVHIFNKNDRDYFQLDFKEKIAEIKEAMLWVDDELHEMLHELPMAKPWKHGAYIQPQIDEMMLKAKKEYVDAFHFMLNIALLLDLDAGELYSMYVNKNEENHERQNSGY